MIVLQNIQYTMYSTLLIAEWTAMHTQEIIAVLALFCTISYGLLASRPAVRYNERLVSRLPLYNSQNTIPHGMQWCPFYGGSTIYIVL